MNTLTNIFRSEVRVETSVCNSNKKKSKVDEEMFYWFEKWTKSSENDFSAMRIEAEVLKKDSNV